MNRAVILLVDDEPNVLNSLKRVFRKEDYEILCTTKPAEAVEMIKQSEIDVIISDQRMPEMTGVELLIQARALRPDTIRMMLTGYADLKSAEDAINKGEVFRFFLKPWNDEDLKRTVRQALQQLEMKRENRRLIAIMRQQNSELKKHGKLLENQIDAKKKQLEESQQKLIQTEKMASLGLLAGGVAHEINNPLGGILTMTQLILQDVPENSQLHADLKEIEAAALHTKAVVGNLLHFARQGRETKTGLVSLNDVFTRVKGLVGHSLDIKDINLGIRIPPELPSVWGDSNKLQQVFLNLITNAAQAMNSNGEIHVDAETDKESGEVVIRVIDNGVGIPPDVLPKIFDPFFTTKAEGEGTGLGLSVTYGIVQEHRGTIEVESAPGKGATFTVRLPIHATTPDDTQEAFMSPQQGKDG